jgi:hypothetical protein
MFQKFFAFKIYSFHHRFTFFSRNPTAAAVEGEEEGRGEIKKIKFLMHKLCVK